MAEAGWRWGLFKTEFVSSPAEPGDGPFTYRGRQVQTLIAQGSHAAAPEGTYLMRLSLWSPDVEASHPLCDITFAVGMGHWVWVPWPADEDAGDYQAADEQDLVEWARADARRDDVIRSAYRAGVTKARIAALTGIARTTINRILA